MPRAARTTTDHSHADLEKEIAALRKEVAELRAQLAKRPARGAGGADPRVDALWESQGGEGNPTLAKLLKK
jgi:hypothetical protein